MRMRLNLEIAGIAAFGLAMLLGIALVAPARSGAIGAAMAHALVAAFGGAAWLCPILVAIFGGIVFLEINVPRMIGTLGFASLCYFAIADAFYGTAGGAFGTILQRGLRSLVGTTGATLFLIVAALAVTVWITNVSVKRVIGLGIVLAARLRAFVKSRAPAPREAPEARAPAVPAIPRPTTIREAFNLPAEMPKSTRRPAKTTVPRSRRSLRSTRARSSRVPPSRSRSKKSKTSEEDEELEELDDEIYDEDELEDDELEDDDEEDEEELEDDDEIYDEDELEDEDDEEEELEDEEAAEPLVAAPVVAACRRRRVRARGRSRRTARIPNGVRIVCRISRSSIRRKRRSSTSRIVRISSRIRSHRSASARRSRISSAALRSRATNSSPSAA